MNIAVVGTGYVGLITGVVFAELGNKVVCVDVDKKKIDLLRSGVPTIYEPGLELLMKKNVKEGRLTFGTSLGRVLEMVDVVFSSVGTPPDEDGSADLKYVRAVAKEFAENLMSYKILVTKSTVPVGTADIIKKDIEEIINKRGVHKEFDVASNPEFLKEGSAIDDCLNPDRVVIGTDSERAKMILNELYKPFGDKVVNTDIHSAEMIKYASNSMLATRISFINEISNLCEKVGADVEMVAKGMGLDRRIGKYFLNAGCGYGGSCFPKDVRALIQTARENRTATNVLDGVVMANESQKNVIFEKALNELGKVKGKKFAIWGLAFKPNTDDMREATSLVTIDLLKRNGCGEIRVTDPVAMNECNRRIGDEVVYCSDIYKASEGVDAILILTEWNDFKNPDLEKLSELVNNKLIIDGRNVIKSTSNGFRVVRMGKPTLE